MKTGEENEEQKPPAAVPVEPKPPAVPAGSPAVVQATDKRDTVILQLQRKNAEMEDEIKTVRGYAKDLEVKLDQAVKAGARKVSSALDAADEITGGLLYGEPR